MKQLGKVRTNGFALVITLIMVVLAAILVVALVNNSSLDRTTSLAYSNRYRAELAVQNGLEAAKKVLAASPTAANAVTADDTFLVLRADGHQTNATSGTKDAYYFMAKPQGGAANTVDCFPLFAGGQPSTVTIDGTGKVALPQVPTAPFQSQPAQQLFGSTTKVFPAVLPFQEPPYTQWQEVRDPNDTATGGAHKLPYQRYTFWVEDLSGYVDPTVAGNISANGSSNARPLDPSTPVSRYKTTPAELPLFTIFDPTSKTDPGTPQAQDLINNRPLLLTVPTLLEIAHGQGAGGVDLITPNFGARFHTDSEMALVPFGYGYKDEGNPSTPKLDLNAQVTTGGDTAVKAIAAKINDNLPTFGTQRQGGLSGQDYVKTIAASMIDYADTDSDATVGPDYRGLDSYPLVSELYNRKWWSKAAYLNASTGTYFVHVEMDTWAELWNMTNQPINGACSLELIENSPLQVDVNTFTFGIKPSDVPSPSSVSSTYPAGNPFTVTLKANEYGVYYVRHDEFEFDTGVMPPLMPTNGTTGMVITGSKATNYNLKWSGTGGSPTIIVDHAGTLADVGVSRVGGKLNGYGVSNKRWSGGYPGFGYTDVVNNSNSEYNLPGDPRSSYFIQSAQVAVAYSSGSSFWERNNRSNIPPGEIYAAVKPSVWPDGGHDSTTVTATPTPKAYSDPPAAPPQGVVTESAKAPVTISNAGSYQNLAELGNIYDPGQWNVTVDATNHWTDITMASQASGKYGGGYQLRIGRPEFTLFDKPGTRAWQLLDLFTTSPRVSSAGLININTASRDVLRVLGAAVFLNRDSEIQPASLKDNLYPPATSKQGDEFADAVLAARPFLSPAALSSLKIQGGTTSIFGDPAAWNGSQTAPTEWTDSARKEYFAKVLPLATVRSRNFRVFVTGQSLDKTGNVLSTVSKVFQVYLDPVRDATGKITSQTIVTSYEANLPL